MIAHKVASQKLAHLLLKNFLSCYKTFLLFVTFESKYNIVAALMHKGACQKLSTFASNKTTFYSATKCSSFFGTCKILHDVAVSLMGIVALYKASAFDLNKSFSLAPIDRQM